MSKSNWRFPLILASGMIVFELLIVGIDAFGEPRETHWLGATIVNSSDQAVYLAYIRQGSLALANPFAVEPHWTRIDPFWSFLSIIHAWTRTPPIVIHEIARVLATIALAFAIHTAARHITNRETDAGLMSFLAASGIGLGWIHIVLVSSGVLPEPVPYIFPDLASEFAVAPSLLGGAHIILSIALLVFIMRRIWDAASRALPTAAAIFLLTSFHPYFIPLIAATIVVHTAYETWSSNRGICLNRPLLYAAALAVPFASYLRFLDDPVFRNHHFQTNALPVADIISWFFVLIPAAAALLWMRRATTWRAIAERAPWCVAWLAVAALLAVFLPVPWSRKFLEGLMIPIVFLTAPAWIALYGWTRKHVWRGFFFIIALFPAVSLTAAQLSWNDVPKPTQAQMSQHRDVFKAWEYLQTRNGAVVLADTMTANLWTPGWSGARVWYGHRNETPSFDEKRAFAQRLFDEADVETVRAHLAETPITHLLVTAGGRRAWAESVASDGWSIVIDLPHAILLERAP